MVLTYRAYFQLFVRFKLTGFWHCWDSGIPYPLPQAIEVWLRRSIYVEADQMRSQKRRRRKSA